MDWNGHMTTGGWVVSILSMLVLLAILVVAVVWISSEFVRRGKHQPASLSAQDILDRRLANGELEPEQYRQLRAALADQPAEAPPPPPSHVAGAHS